MEKEVALREHALAVALEIQRETDDVEKLIENARQIEKFITIAKNEEND